MNKKFDLLVFIGRFQPFHLEHKRIIDVALTQSKYVLVLVGSSGKSRTIRNPFTFDERTNMIAGSYNESDRNRIIIKPLFDKTYNDAAWINQVQTLVRTNAIDAVNDFGFPNAGHADAKVGLIGASKDQSSYYLKMFPQYDSVDVPIEFEVNATNIREDFLEGINRNEVEDDVPENVAQFLYEKFADNPIYKQLQNELIFARNYKKQWEVAPYPVKHVAVDAVVEQSGHILLVKRRSEPGKGLYALPGGHLNEFERMEDGMIRELREETKIKVPQAVLRGCIHGSKTFDDPYRSTIGRVITQAFHIKLTDDVALPKVKGSDDAEKAMWVPLSDLKEEDFFDDHHHIIQYFLGL